MDIEHLRFPIGKYIPSKTIDQHKISQWINDMEELPILLRNAVADLELSRLDRPYRPEGWTRRQVVNHIADSHMNAYIRVKFALTEESPTIKPYNEASWVLTPEVEKVDILQTLALIESLHCRWALLFRNLPTSAFSRSYFHPEQQEFFTLANVAGLYAWHGKHHLAQIENPAF